MPTLLSTSSSSMDLIPVINATSAVFLDAAWDLVENLLLSVVLLSPLVSSVASSNIAVSSSFAPVPISLGPSISDQIYFEMALLTNVSDHSTDSSIELSDYEETLGSQVGFL